MSPLGWMTAGNVSRSVSDDNGSRLEDMVARWLETLWSRGAEEASARGHDEAHALVHRPERRLGGVPGLLRADREEALELAVVGAELSVALLDRGEQLDHGLGHVGLERAVALAVV